jgi:hypothetical protein
MLCAPAEGLAFHWAGSASNITAVSPDNPGEVKEGNQTGQEESDGRVQDGINAYTAIAQIPV